ncbi:uracil-DNA glycosylase [Camelliibacillus cellulosilyticus]|uniref:Uracil-DNA glycosylase n=1 Tax=Camelliibacillus cellulosilyticus TaxID=2174486 RepID=A0ABV9GTF7_9BACL
MAVQLKNDWGEHIGAEFKKDYYLKLRAFLKYEYATGTIYPDQYDIFNALHYTAYEDVKAVILGQDPYHGPGQAHGLSFSVQKGVPQPPSLQNIFKELHDDLGYPIPSHGCLVDWTKQGVMLLNTVLTVRHKSPNSHKGMGWEQLTDRIIRVLSEREKPMVFILWGRHAQEKAAFIDTSRHHIIQSPHPSPFSANRGFFGSRPFSRTNQFLVENGLEPIDWRLSD